MVVALGLGAACRGGSTAGDPADGDNLDADVPDAEAPDADALDPNTNDADAADPADAADAADPADADAGTDGDAADGDATEGGADARDGDPGDGDAAEPGEGEDADGEDAAQPEVELTETDAADGDAVADGDAEPEADSPVDRNEEPGGYGRGSLAVCWTDAACPRVMAVGHGGLWNVLDAPYDSDAAIAAAYEGGMDGVKIDVRVTADDVPVISHSSPIEAYESLDCMGKKIEEMTADEVTQCHRLPSTTETFQRLDAVLGYLRGKMVVQLCVKESTDLGRTIDEIHARGAEDFAFIELSTGELQSIIPTLPGSDTVYYLVNVGSSLGEIDTLLDVIQHPRAFMFELDPTVDLGTVGDLVANRLHPAGVRSFTYDDAQITTVTKLRGLFEAGFDVVSANGGAQAVQARIAVNQSRGVDPP